MSMFDWLRPKGRPDVVLWSNDDGRLYYGNYFEHPAGKRVVKLDKYGDFLICDDDGSVKKFNGQPHSWIVGWRRNSTLLGDEQG